MLANPGGSAAKKSDQICSLLSKWYAERCQSYATPTARDLFPPDWYVGNALVEPTRDGVLKPEMEALLPAIIPIRTDGGGAATLDGGADLVNWNHIDRLEAEWPPAGDMIATLLSSLSCTNRVYTPTDVLDVAQQSPDAVEKLNVAARELKNHFEGFLNPGCSSSSSAAAAAAASPTHRDHGQPNGRPSRPSRRPSVSDLLDFYSPPRHAANPELNAVVSRYRAELRTLIEIQHSTAFAAKLATYMVNDCLARRDAALARYARKVQ